MTKRTTRFKPGISGNEAAKWKPGQSGNQAGKSRRRMQFEEAFNEALLSEGGPEEAARFIGCQDHDIPILVRAGLLKPLGPVPPNAVKYFSKRKVLKLCDDDAWLDRVTKALVRHWQNKNGRRKETIRSRRDGLRYAPSKPPSTDGSVSPATSSLQPPF